MNTPAFAESQACPPLVGFEFESQHRTLELNEEAWDEAALELAARHVEMAALENGWGYGPS